MSTYAPVATNTGDAIVDRTTCRPCELAHRVSNGIEVTLYWSALDNTTFIEAAEQLPVLSQTRR